MRKGFTLIELLVVISIISLLSSVIFVGLSSAKMKSRDARRKADMNQISKALWLYYDANKVMPPTVGTDTCSDRFTNAMQTLITAGLLSGMPKDPGSGSYCYYNYGPGNNRGAMVRAIFEAEPSTLTGISPSCRPFSGSNWCRSDVTDKQYCMCHPH